ncbi:MAG TPA: hypothetical protein PLB91_03955 [Spirochaetales bacterium]|nr:hypothetical protein [Spirochaetales bacterium]HRY53455.1 hypothetical protein [Spirochaetia bacterium]
MSELKEMVQKLLKGLDGFVTNVSTLSVHTLTGQVSATYDSAKLTWNIVPDKSPTVKASTTIKFDGDLFTVVPVAADGKPDADWAEVHKSAVAMAIEARTAMIQALFGLASKAGL